MQEGEGTLEGSDAGEMVRFDIDREWPARVLVGNRTVSRTSELGYDVSYTI